jgi:hypothetical protein
VTASAKTSPRVSAHLSTTALTAAQAGAVKLTYKFSSRSSRFAYVLSRKRGARWLTVRSVSSRGSFRGSHTIAVRGLFGAKPVTIGHYRLKLSSNANSVTLSFAVVTPRAGQVVVVTATADVVNGDVSSVAALNAKPGRDAISLREALEAADNTGGTATVYIMFNHALNGHTISLAPSYRRSTATMWCSRGSRRTGRWRWSRLTVATSRA